MMLWLYFALASYMVLGPSSILATECGETGRGIVFDAGSSHTSMFIYHWPDNKTERMGRVEEIGDCDAKGGGISDYLGTPQLAGDSLQECLQEAIDLIEEEDHKYTPLYLGSTAGMRLVEETNPVESASIFDSVKETLAATPFNFSNPDRQARIISGENEGIFGWITANYISNRFNVGPSMWEQMVSMVTGMEPTPKPTYGAIDLGGASTQLTFVPEDKDALPEEYKLHKRLYGTDYYLYSNSFLCYGVNEARRRFRALLLKNAGYSTQGVNNPCLHPGQEEVFDGNYLWKAPCSQGPHAMAGWGSEVKPPDTMTDISYDTEFVFNGTSNPVECAATVELLFNTSVPCKYPPCSFNGIHQPKPHGNFLAFSALYWVVDALLGTSTPSIGDLETAKNEFCRKTLQEVQIMPGYDEYYLGYCFNIHYIWSLLIERYGFDESNWNIEFVRKVNGVSVGWTMGYMIDATSRIPSEVECGNSAVTNSLFQYQAVIFLSIYACMHVLIS
ncbi:ectonucleoside triphosphate diphosphohydrolase 8-like [Amphiura filiformis]|uniref:ectonucleoside triphosphate diphosphohydrolase 8-like n=1 Tax=Amphiura filiformis TaxID=82378 RepID=UPI003B221481